jgi:hypothetical protein
MNKKNDSTCIIYVAIAITAVCIYNVVEFLKNPEAINKIKYFFTVIGLCIGSAILLLACLSIYIYITDTITERVSWQGKDYPVRCHVVKMNKCERQDHIPGNLAEEPEQDTKTPIYLNVRIVGRGICITAYSKIEKEEKPTSNTAIPFGLFNRDWTDPLIIPICYMNLYYIICRHKEGLVSELTPADSAGYEDEEPKIPSGGQLEIVILFMKFIQKSNLNKTESLDQPLKLKMFVVNDDGENNAIGTLELYKTIYERTQPATSDDDDSWMYRSRPVLW